MPQARRELGPGIFQVTLYFKNNSWLFSTSAYSSHTEAALEFAEREFSVHALHHNLGNIRARFACVTDQLDNYYFAKTNGKWRMETRQTHPKPTRTAGVRVFQGENQFRG